MTGDVNNKTQQQTSPVPIIPLHRDTISTGPISKEEMSVATFYFDTTGDKSEEIKSERNQK